jgi:hypothetical protein
MLKAKNKNKGKWQGKYLKLKSERSKRSVKPDINQGLGLKEVLKL